MLSYNDKILTRNTQWLVPRTYGPPGSGKWRFQFTNKSYVPSTLWVPGYWTAVDASNGIWDYTPTSIDDRLLPFGLADPNMGYAHFLGTGTGSVPDTVTAIEVFNGSTRLRTAAAFDVPSTVTDISNMFTNCTNLTAIGAFDFSDCTITDAITVFANTPNLKTLPDGIDFTGVTNGRIMFDGSGITRLPDSISFPYLTNADSMFLGSAIEEFPIGFDLPSCTTMRNFCGRCGNLKHVPLMPLQSVLDVNYAFGDCVMVESGALALYNALKNRVTSHDGCFTNCGRDTVTGAAELGMIPSSWGGTGT